MRLMSSPPRRNLTKLPRNSRSMWQNSVGIRLRLTSKYGLDLEIVVSEYKDEISFQSDLNSVRRYTDGTDIDDAPRVVRRLLGDARHVPSEIAYGLLMPHNDALFEQGLGLDERCHEGLIVLAQSEKKAAAAIASSFLYRDFDDSRNLDIVREALLDSENGAFYDVSFAVYSVAKRGDGEALAILTLACHDPAIDGPAKEIIQKRLDELLRLRRTN